MPAIAPLIDAYPTVVQSDGTVAVAPNLPERETAVAGVITYLVKAYTSIRFRERFGRDAMPTGDPEAEAYNLILSTYGKIAEGAWMQSRNFGGMMFRLAHVDRVLVMAIEDPEAPI